MLLPLSQVAEARTVTVPARINRENNQRRWVISGNVRGRDMGGVVNEIRHLVKENVTLPAGYYLEYGGQFEYQKRAMGRPAIIVPVTRGLIFLLLCMSLSSVLCAGLIFINVPPALTGGVFGPHVTGECLSVPVSVQQTKKC